MAPPDFLADSPFNVRREGAYKTNLGMRAQSYASVWFIDEMFARKYFDEN
jgi:hypothetical protein